MMRRKMKTEINAGSMADIAFLLLIFFLVATTFIKEKAVKMTLPPYFEGPAGQKADNQVFDIKINTAGEILVEKEKRFIQDLALALQSFVLDSPELHPKDAVVSIQLHSKTPYKHYLAVYHEIKVAYEAIRNSRAMELYQKPYNALSNADKNVLITAFPMRISEADPYIEEMK